MESNKNTLEGLEKLGILYKSGALSKEEFNTLKNELLGKNESSSSQIETNSTEIEPLLSENIPNAFESSLSENTTKEIPTVEIIEEAKETINATIPEPKEKEITPRVYQPKSFEPEEKSNKIYYIVFGVILLLIGLFVFYKMSFAGPSAEQLNAMEKAKQDSIASSQLIAQQRIDDSLNNAGYESEGNSNEEETQPIVNTDEISTKIYKYYEDIQLDRIDAVDYFAPNVSQYITKKNLTPADINNSISKGKEEFSKPEIVLDINNIVNTRTENEIRYYCFQIHFKCYRTSKQKTQVCDVTVEIGVNQSNEFVSIKETKIENLKFYDEDLNIPNQELSSTKTSNEIYSTVEEMPQFPGGAMEMMKYIQNNIQYPQMAKEAGLSGKCYLKFIVTADGSIKDIQILKGVPGCKECDTEATRVVSSMPNWKAGKQDGRAVNVFFNLPINFQLR